MKKIMWGAMVMLGAMQGCLAAEQVWRYVDASSGQVTYSNVQVKGLKGDKMEIMAYPAPRVPSGPSSITAVSAPIPPEVLRQLQGAQRSGALPTGLPPLPTLPGARLPSGMPLSLAGPKAEATADDVPGNVEPKWAKEVAAPASGPSPKWASDPFSPQR